jgi:hypothetical protein
VADVTGERSRAQLLLVGALALAVIFLSLSLLLNSVIYTENLATRQTHADVEKAETFRTAVVDGLGGAVEYANRRNVTGFADRRDAYRAATDDWIPILANHSATDGVAGDVDREGVQEGTRIVDANASTGIVNRNGDSDWTMATDSSVRQFRLNVTLSSVDSPDDTIITIDDGTAQDVVIEDDGSGPQVHVVGRGTCELTRGHVDIGAGRVDGDYCPPLADVRPTGTVDVSVSNGDGIDAAYSFVVDRHSEGFRTAVDTANFPGQCTPPSPPTYATTAGDDPYTTPAIYAATARIGVATQDLDYRRTVRAAPDEAGSPASEPTFTEFNVTKSGNDFDANWNSTDPNGDIDHVDVRMYYVTNGTLYDDTLDASADGTTTFKDVPGGYQYYINGTVTEDDNDHDDHGAASTRRVSEVVCS